MRKTTTILLSFSLFLFSCKDKSKTPKQEKIKPEIHKELYGSYVGSFSDYKYDGDISSTMSLNVNMISEDGVKAYCFVNGIKRALSGTLNDKNPSSISLELEEPGDKKSDGIFHLTVNGDSIVGTWKPLLANSVLKTKDISLSKKKFEYNPNVMLDMQEEGQYLDQTSHKDSVIYPYEDSSKKEIISFYRSASDAVDRLNASKEVLSESQLKNLKKIDLEIVKNTVYARHGYAFKSKTARQFFDYQEWYMPLFDDVEDKLTQTEQTNIATLNRFIKYAQNNYDTFGR